MYPLWVFRFVLFFFIDPFLAGVFNLVGWGWMYGWMMDDGRRSAERMPTSVRLVILVMFTFFVFLFITFFLFYGG